MSGIELVNVVEEEVVEEEAGSSLFRRELCSVINKHSQENGSDTPDFILANYLTDCLAAFDKATVRRDKWYRHDTETVPEGARS